MLSNQYDHNRKKLLKEENVIWKRQGLIAFTNNPVFFLYAVFRGRGGIDDD